MNTLTMNLVGSSPLFMQADERLEDVKFEIIQNFKRSLLNVAKEKKLLSPVIWNVRMEGTMANPSNRLSRRIGMKKYDHWQLVLTIKYNAKSINKGKILEIVELAANRKES